jgi:uncharacterized membrane protein
MTAPGSTATPGTGKRGPLGFRARLGLAGRGPERLEAFSDGVFAIAITLLILEVRVPSGEELSTSAALAAALSALWPSYLAYAIGFSTIGIMWINHHNLLRHVERVDHGLMLANLFLLGLVAFVPFPTALLAATLTGPGQQLGVLAFLVTFVALTVGFNVFWYAARRGGDLIRAEADRRSIEAITRAYALGIPGSLLALAAGFVNPLVGLALSFALAGFYLLPGSTGT